MKKQQFEIRKIHLETFMDFLMDACTAGAVYVDLVFSPGKKQDNIKIIVVDEPVEEEENNDVVPPMELTDDSINSLI